MINCDVYDKENDNRTHKILWGKMSMEDIGNIQSLYSSRDSHEIREIHILLEMLYVR